MKPNEIPEVDEQFHEKKLYLQFNVFFQKGAGYHLDMLIVGVMMGVSSVLGLPWCVAATVLCLGHVDSLKMETESTAPGEKPRFLGIREQRVTGTIVFLLTGLSVKLAPVLKVSIP